MESPNTHVESNNVTGSLLWQSQWSQVEICPLGEAQAQWLVERLGVRMSFPDIVLTVEGMR